MQPSNEDIFQTNLALYEQELSNFVEQRTASTEMAEDILQEVWARFSEVIKQEEIEQPRAWLYRVARNLMTDEYRRRGTRPSITPLQDELSIPDYFEPDEFESDDEVWEQIQAAIDTLPENQRIVFVKNELEGLTLREIAEDENVSIKTIISRKGYARRRLQDLLRSTYEEFFGMD